MNELLREKLAAHAHSQWSGWMRYLFTKSKFNREDGTYTIPAWAVQRWRRQMETFYDKLTPMEQESDKEEADQYLKILKEENHHG